ncbi:cytochrome P450 [Ktedonosporobacter rubrisoli]|uniref:Cytochrome P450 n=1 Tax=Ktedonosporobacter rubrisoli TaxID=2509675 RepID=A0A4P6JL95_KTERU|nr:cytochrome P450 [Ktedonosporobacter rubrisoli]QBD75790.1 cytochrome P450 [Ktedonosporobacter rubrisoli]
MSNEQEAKVQEVKQEAPLSFPIPFADHSLEMPETYEQLRQECPVARISMPYGGDAFLLTRHSDVAKAATDSRRCGTIKQSDGDVPRREAGNILGGKEESLFGVSDARHNQIRRLVTQAFTVKRANAMLPHVVEVTNELIDAMERKGPPADLFEDYAIKTPMAVICELLGIPSEDELLFREWGRAVLSVTLSTEEQQGIWMKMSQYIMPLIAKEQANPSDTVLGLLVKGHEQGDAVLTQGEMLSFALGLIVAGFETVSTTFTNSAFILLQRPELLAQLKERLDEPERLASAIEEVLRITPVGAGRPRIVREEIEFSETPVKPGEVVFLSFNAANYDESVFPHAKKVDFDRTSNPVLTFGRGIHACLGQQLARMELQALWSTLLKRWPEVRLAVAPSEVPWRPDDTLTFGPAHIPVVW